MNLLTKRQPASPTGKDLEWCKTDKSCQCPLAWIRQIPNWATSYMLCWGSTNTAPSSGPPDVEGSCQTAVDPVEGGPGHEVLKAAALGLRELHLLNLAKILITAYSHLKSNCKDDGVNLFSKDNIKRDNFHELWLGIFESHIEVMGGCFLYSHIPQSFLSIPSTAQPVSVVFSTEWV